MNLFERMAGFEQIDFGTDETAGLRTIIAVYSTARGPALGGTRIYPYASETDALADVLRLGKAMAYKAAMADLPLGGGKAVIIADPATEKTPALLRAYGRHVERLGGRYITTADVGSTVADLDVIAQTTRHITGTSAGSGDPSIVTAHGVWHGMRAVAQRLDGEPSLRDRSVVVVGAGKVGAALIALLVADGARVTIADVRKDVVEQLAEESGAAVADPGTAATLPCDILSPCALGGIVNDATIDALACRAIAGAANNQLERPAHGDALAARGILYAPDYVINAGGLINVADELQGYDAERARRKAEGIAATLTEVFAEADAGGITPAAAADRIAAARIAAASRG